MEHYITYKEVQDIIEDAYKNKGHPLQSAQVAGNLNPMDYPTQKHPLRVSHLMKILSSSHTIFKGMSLI